MIASRLCTLNSKCNSRSPLNAIVEKLNNIRRKPSRPQKRSSVEMDNERLEIVQNCSNSQIQTANNSERSASLRRKANKPCKYIRDEDMMINQEDLYEECFEPERKRLRGRNTLVDVDPNLDNLSLRSGRMLKGPVSGIVKKLVLEMIEKVALEIDHLPQPPCRPGRRAKAWFDPTLAAATAKNTIQLKRRRGRPPKFNTEVSSPVLMQRIIHELVNRVCWEVDGVITPRRRGRPPKTNAVPKNATPRPRGRPRGSPNKVYSGALSESRRGRFPGRRGRPPKYFLASFDHLSDQTALTNGAVLNEHRNGIPVSLAHRRGRGSRSIVPYPLTDVHAAMLLTRKRGRPPKFCLSHADRNGSSQFPMPEYSTFVSPKNDIQCQTPPYCKFMDVKWYT